MSFTELSEPLELISTIGFNGNVRHGLKIHPDGEHMVYPLGYTVIVENIKTHEQKFLAGHNDNVSCIAISRDGKYLASGQVTHMGFKAVVIVWDFAAKESKFVFTLHKVNVESVEFSPNSKYVISLGGRDDGSIAVWDLSTGEALCGAASGLKSSGSVYSIKFFNNTDERFITGGNGTLRLWEIDRENRKVRPQEVQLGQLKRNVACLVVDPDDLYFYAGTTTGDVLKVTIKTGLFKASGPQKDLFSLGVTAIVLLKDGTLVLSTGSGLITTMNTETLKRNPHKECKVDGVITSLAKRGAGHQLYVGVAKGNIHMMTYDEFTPTCVMSCHYSGVLDVSFPEQCSDLFVTCSKENIRVWVTETSTEVLRIVVPNMTCHQVAVSPDGRSIISGWNDGKIRAYTPQSGKEQYVVHDAHKQGVTAIACTSDGHRIVSGGGEGQVRVWQLTPHRQNMVAAMKEHKGVVNCIRIRKNDTECISASDDGTCIVWDLNRFTRNQIIFANTLFKSAVYHPEETQILTGGSDRKISYWENLDGSQIREMEGSSEGSINGLDISGDGQYFVSGGDSRKVKVWKYNEGDVSHVGIGHSGKITCVKICPKSKYIVSASVDGGILRWRYPF